eukprot:CAMPEP_0178400748 /NCGR_PEP_ID=MMETSP0689_2-20121128/15948_1 /TAXON_ID=160604 /ORGANISM="Amphidinium massartii, Strain CS-259" /LENGTH=133 /DNA_ID=CAMNT_0020021551 /DNA_START=75 /DNA_END=472 /DNA_ORIENTATION=+
MMAAAGVKSGPLLQLLAPAARNSEAVTAPDHDGDGQAHGGDESHDGDLEELVIQASHGHGAASLDGVCCQWCCNGTSDGGSLRTAKGTRALWGRHKCQAQAHEANHSHKADGEKGGPRALHIFCETAEVWQRT